MRKLKALSLDQNAGGVRDRIVGSDANIAQVAHTADRFFIERVGLVGAEVFDAGELTIDDDVYIIGQLVDFLIVRHFEKGSVFDLGQDGQAAVDGFTILGGLGAEHNNVTDHGVVFATIETTRSLKA